MRPGNFQVHEVHTLVLITLDHSAFVELLDPPTLKDKVDLVLVLDHLADIEYGEVSFHIFEIDWKGLAVNCAADLDSALAVQLRAANSRRVIATQRLRNVQHVLRVLGELLLDPSCIDG